MKKLFFSAIALVAFSGVSMANTVEVEDSIETIVSDTPCTDDWVADMKFYQKYGYSFEEALVFADEAWDICMDELYGD